MNFAARAQLATRAQHAMLHLAKNTHTTRTQLGAGRERLNMVHNGPDDLAQESVEVLEDLVVTVYHGIPTMCPECRCTVTDQTTLDGIHTTSCTTQN